MGAQETCVVPLAGAAGAGDGLVGGKAARLGSLIQAGFRVPRGFCITTRAYEQFVAEAGLGGHIAMELGRKPLDAMRWEELWDAALRIRSAFLRAAVPEVIAGEIRRALADHIGNGAVAVRSSAPGEDSRQVSFAGLHESIVGVEGDRAVLDAVRAVRASLWSDAALLYRRELSLDPHRSRMAVLVQAVELAERSGVAFNRDPRSLDADRAVIEAVPGPCALLVDGSVDPDRWILARQIPELHRHPLIAGGQLLVPRKEVPVERRERGGVGARRRFRVVAAALAGIAHPVEVRAPRAVGLRRDHAAVCELAHAQVVGQLHPVDRIDVDGEIPLGGS